MIQKAIHCKDNVCQPLLKMSQNKSISDTKKTLHKQNMQTRQISYAKV